MRSRLTRIAMLLLPLLAGLPARAIPLRSNALQGGARYVPGEVLVTFKPQSAASSRSAAIRRLRSAQLSSLDSEGRMLHLRLDPAQSVDEAVRAYATDPAVESAQPNFIYHATAVPNDPKYSQMWGLKNTAQTIATDPAYADPPRTQNNPGVASMDIRAEAAWDRITDCSSVTVAVVDTGVNYNLTDLSANMWNGGGSYPNHGYDFVDNDNAPMDLNGHGTHVAGTIGAVGNNGVGTVGICWRASIMAVRVLDASGSGTTAAITQGVNFAVAQGAKVINMSLGGGASDTAFNNAITAATTAGVVVVVAAGNEATDNDSGTPSYPCNYTQPGLFCVAALDQNYAMANYSNYGATSVDIAAPGSNIVSLWPGTVTTILDDFTTGWTRTGAWAHQVISLTSGGVSSPYDMLTNPATWNASNLYANNADDKAYKTINLAGGDVLSLEFDAFVETESGNDVFTIAMSPSGGDPFSAGTVLDGISGGVNGTAYPFSYDVTPCATASCTLGFRFTSNASVAKSGIGIVNFDVKKLTLGTAGLNVISGTSMATPHVAGLVALVLAYNPQFSGLDAINAIKSGGVALSALAGKTTSGRAIDALGALNYISPPTGLRLAP
jgi:thermitase